MRIRSSLLAGVISLAASSTVAAHEYPAQAEIKAWAETVAAPDSALGLAAGSEAGRLANQALEYLGIRYRFGGTSPETGFDCSGLVLNVFRNAIGLDLPRTSAEMARVGDKISRQDLKPGDLVFFNTMRRAFSHVGIYLGDNRFVHAPSAGGKVRVEKLSARYWADRFNGARRFVPHQEIASAEAFLRLR